MPVLARLPTFVRERLADNVGGMKTSQQSKISISEFKKLLGSAALSLSDSEIERLRDLEDHLADIVFDSWLRKRNPQPGAAELSE